MNANPWIPSLVLFAGLLLAMVGCGPRTEIAQESAQQEPLAQGERAVKREEWVSEPLTVKGDLEIRVSAILNSGPAVDMYVVTEAGFNRWNSIVSSGQATTESEFETIPMLGLEGLSASFTSEWAPLTPGTYYLVLDNSSFGGTAPPASTADDIAVVNFTVESRAPAK